MNDFREIIEATQHFIDEYWFENLNLRGDYKQRILTYIHEKYPQLDGLYHTIFQKNDVSYLEAMAADFTAYCQENGIKFVNAFNHAKLVREKKAAKRAGNQDI